MSADNVTPEQHLTTMYMTGGWSKLIEPVQVVKRTKHFVTWLRQPLFDCDKPTQARTSSENFHGTWEDAKNFLIANAERQVQYAKVELDRRTAALQKIRAMKP